jgi:hypothetical protein
MAVVGIVVNGGTVVGTVVGGTMAVVGPMVGGTLVGVPGSGVAVIVSAVVGVGASSAAGAWTGKTNT